MNRSRWITVAVVLVVVALLAVWWRAQHSGSAQRFRTAGVERGTVDQMVSATGTVNPVVQVEVGSQVSGTVAELFADYNARVSKGQVLLELDPSSFKARLAQSEAAVARAEAALLDGQRQYKRAQELLPGNYVSQADLDAAEVLVKTREADLKQARAQLDASRVDLANTIIRAPIDGVVISRNIDRGQTVAASLSAPKLFVIANDLSAMQIETRIDESDIGVIHPGLRATFTVDAFPDNTFTGEVQQVRLEPITEQNVVTYTTVILTRNPDLKLRPGMTANVSVLVAHRDDVLKVPNSALRFRPPSDGKKRGGWGARGGDSSGGARGGAAGASGAGASGAGGERGAAAGAGSGATAQGSGERPTGGGGMAPGGRGAGGASGSGGRGRWGGGGAMASGAGGGTGSDAGGVSDEVRREIFQRVRSGELTREQAIEMIRSKAAEGGGSAAGGRANAAGSGAAPGAASAPVEKHGTVYVMRAGTPTPVQVTTGITDGVFTEIKGDALRPGDIVIVGLDLGASGGATPPPGMGGGGPMMGGRR